MKRFCKQLDGKDSVVFTVMGQSFLYSANTLTYFPLTECAKEIILSDQFDDENNICKEICDKYSEKEIKLTVKKIDDFKSNGLLSPVKTHEKGDIYYGDYYLKLVQTTRCNLRCSYCFANKTSKNDMSFETAKKAIDFFIEKFIPDNNRRIIVDLTGAGEPLVRLDFILQVNDYVQLIKHEKKINIFCQLATNGMLLNEKVSSLLKKNSILFGVSLDGNKEVSEKNRIGLDYELVSKNMDLIKDKTFFGLAATYSGSNHDFIEIFKSLNKFNPEVVGMKPVRIQESEPNSINMNNIEQIKDSYDRFLKWIYKQLVGKNTKAFDAFIKSEDFLVRYLKTVIRPMRIFYRCSSAVNSFAVDSKENILICPAFIGIKDGVLGNLTDGFDAAKQKRMENLYADKIEYCKDCWARYTCGGECFSVGYMNNGIIEKPAPAMCELKKYLIQLSIYFWTCLRYEHEEIYLNLTNKLIHG